MGRRNSILCIIGVLGFMSVVKAQDPRGTPGVDYPNYFTIPETSFKCSDQKYNPGFYADLETKCQAFHFCYQDRMESFLCPTGTIFNQAVLTCDVWYKSNCSLSQIFYSVNAGPVMERAGKNLPMLLRLRNRSQSKSAVKTPSVLDKESSVSESVNEPPSEASSISKSDGLKAESNDKAIGSSVKDLENKNDKQTLLDRHEYSEKDGSEEINKFANEIDEEMDINLVYDGVNDGYYKNYDQYDGEWQDTDPESKFDYDYKEQHPQKDERKPLLKDYIDESFEDSDFTIVDSKYPEFTKRSSQTSPTRIRRKPVYVDDQSAINAEEISDLSNLESDLLNSNLREGKEMNLPSESVEAETPSPTPFPRPTAIPHHQLNIASVTPMTSEEFEHAILSEIAYPNPYEIDVQGAEDFAAAPQSDQAFSQSESYNRSPDIERDDTIYIENDIEPDSYIPYNSQYVVVPPKSNEEVDSDTEDTFVVIPDEYDDNVDLEVPDYSEETAYRTRYLADQSLATGYYPYNSYRYSSIVDYPQYYEQANYPEQKAQMFENYVPSERYVYESSYGLQNQPLNYESSDFDSETYAETEFHPYAETRLGITERPVALPVTEEDMDDFSNDFGEIAESEQDMVTLENEPGQPEDVYYVLDFDEQSNQGNETEMLMDEKMKLDESFVENSEQVNEQNPKVEQLNSSSAETSVHNEFPDNGSEQSNEFTKTDESYWSSDFLSTSKNDHIEPDNVKSDINTKSNTLTSSRQTPIVHDSVASNSPFSSNMGSFDFSSDSRFLNNMGYSESMEFGPYGFGPNMGQQFMMESMQSKATTNPFSQRISPAEQPRVSPLSAIQEKMRSMKQGKFGAFKKYMSSTNQ